MVGITHGVFFFRIRKDPLNGLLALPVQRFPTIGLAKLLYNVQIFLPNMCGEYFLTLLICIASAFRRTIDTVLWRTPVDAFSFLVGGRMPQYSFPRTDELVVGNVICVIPREICVFLVVASGVWQDRYISIVQCLLGDPWCFVS